MIESFNGPFANFSNFAPVVVELWERKYPSVEHAYQSAKNEGEEWKKYCQSDVPAGRLKQASRHVKLVANWDTLKVDIMRWLVWCKFQQEPFKTLLLSTGDQHIQEGNWWNDAFWGVNLKTGQGQNVLGQMIMETRKLLRGGVK